MATETTATTAPLAVDAATAARMIGISRSRLWQLVAAQQIPSVQIGGRGSRRVFRVAALSDWLRAEEKRQARGGRR